MNSINQNLIEYLKHNYTENDMLKEVKKNSLQYILPDLVPNNSFQHVIHKLRYKYHHQELLEIIDKFTKLNIPHMVFKGIVLGKQLYKEPLMRNAGDIDIFVNENHFQKALQVLFDSDYHCRNSNSTKNKHHVELIKEFIIVELHRNIFNPIIEINERYLLTNKCMKLGICTFNITSTILHLIYHLYMDSYVGINNTFNVHSKRNFATANRFLYRAYEIALFSEKYFKEIKWNDIISDIKTQKLRIIFKYMVDDILEIFPNAFPQELKKAIYNKSYIENEEDMLFYKFLEGYKNHKQEKRYLLCEFIEKFWQRKNNNALLSPDGNAIVLEDKDFNEFKCICNISRNDKNIYLEFTIKDDDIIFSDLGNYDTQKSDGIHLILCSTTDYSYNSIFFFPKNTKENNKVIPYDFLESKVVENDIIASYEMIKNGYKINVTLTEEFITKNHLESFFYLGLVVSSCSSKTKHREKQLVLSSPADQWYNPLHFAKINI